MAKRFKFRLEVVRTLRKRKEDECRRVVAERLRQVNGVRERIGRLMESLRDEEFTIRNHASPGESASGALDMNELRLRHAYVNQLRRNVTAARDELAGLEAEFERERAQLAEASKELKVIDKLEDRQRARHELGVRRAELAEADEIGAQFARRVTTSFVSSLAEADRS